MKTESKSEFTIVKCAWCNTQMRIVGPCSQPTPEDLVNAMISHGICAKCYDGQIAEAKKYEAALKLIASRLE